LPDFILDEPFVHVNPTNVTRPDVSSRSGRVMPSVLDSLGQKIAVNGPDSGEHVLGRPVWRVHVGPGVLRPMILT
jgi:hypothetical protein